MKIFRNINLLVCFFILLSGQFALAQNVRRDSLLNFDWRFSIGDRPEAKNIAYNDKQWQVVQLPHDGSITGAFDTVSGSRQNGFRPRHIGWYRKTFVVPANSAGKLINLDFEGVYRAAEVWLNGYYLGKHLNGYTGFSYDITRLVTPGKPATIAVRYDNTYKQSSRWYTGEGIYRNVWLHVLSPLHVVENGTYITTPFIGDGRVDVAVETTVINQADTASMATLKSIILDPKGRELKVLVSTVPLRAHEVYTYHQYTSIPNPEKWDINSPVSYTVKTYVIKSNRTVDDTQSRFGVRTVAFTPEQGFLLNGRKVFLNGVNIHHDLGPLGAAAFEKGFRRRLLGLKQMGVNAIRLAHNPHAKCVLDMCDELGILVFDESFDKWSSEYYGQGADFHQHWQPDLEWFIRRDRNHPSVFIWSVGNEVAVKQEYKDTAFVVQYDKMAEVVHRLDPSRKVTSGLYPSRDEEVPAPMAFHMDVMSDNYMSRFYKKDHPKYPQLIFLESEMTTDNGGENFFAYDHSYASGQFYWGGTDYIGESFGWPSKGWNGIIDWCDFWKPISYYIKSLYSSDPMVKIAMFDAAGSEARVWNDVAMKNLKMTSGWNWQPGQKLSLYTFTTGDEVELFVNGKSIGTKKLKDFPRAKIAWEVTYEPGSIKAIARKNGKEIATDEIKTAGKPQRIVLKTDSAHMRASGVDLTYITVNVVDQNGVIVPDAASDIHFDVKGAATIAGVANSNRLSDELFAADHRKAYEGKCLLVLRSMRTVGKVQIKASAAGLKSDALQISVQ